MNSNIKPEIFYTIEKTSPNYYGDSRYRFVSNYNGTRGVWHFSKDKAIEDGENHFAIIMALH
jgi:hypothetical protein